MSRAVAVIPRLSVEPRPLTQLLNPATADERRVLNDLAAKEAALLSSMVERALRREFHSGIEVARREVEEELQ